MLTEEGLVKDLIDVDVLKLQDLRMVIHPDKYDDFYKAVTNPEHPVYVHRNDPEIAEFIRNYPCDKLS